jgi:phosphate transport system protein
MTSVATHTLKAFDEDFEALRGEVAALGGLAEAATSDAAEALFKADPALVGRCDRHCDLLLRAAAEAEKHALCMLALRAPVANDLYEILAIVKIVGLLERVALQARSIAAAVPAITHPLVCPRALGNLARMATEALRHALDAFAARDAGAVEAMAQAAEAAEQLHFTLLESCLAEMRLDSRAVPSATNLLLVSRSLARIADHAVDVAVAIRRATPEHHPSSVSTGGRQFPERA